MPLAIFEGSNGKKTGGRGGERKMAGEKGNEEGGYGGYFARTDVFVYFNASLMREHDDKRDSSSVSK